MTLVPSSRRRERRGFVLIVAMIVTFAIASLVLTLGRMARTESLASTNQVAQYQAAAIERGAEQYVLARVENEIDTLASLDESEWEQVPLGEGYFWVVRPDYLDEDLPLFGLVDEAAKIDLNTAGQETLSYFTSMDVDTAYSVVDWKRATADSSPYMGIGNGYRAKAAPYDTVEEMLMVDGVTREQFFGSVALARRGEPVASGFTANDPVASAGWQSYFTAWGTPSGQTLPNGQPAGRALAINQAPRDVVMAYLRMTESQAESFLAKRAAAVQADPNDLTWVDSTGETIADNMKARFVPHGKKFSADIVATSGNGRAFKRVRIVVDATATPAKIVYRRDITADGFPLDASVLESLRTGNGPGGTTDSSSSASRSRSSR